MIPFGRLTWQAALAGRWTARILGTLMVLLVLAFVFGEGPPPLLRMTAREQFYALGVGSLFLGLVVAWFREGWGGLLSVLGWGLLAVLAKRPALDLPFSIPGAVGLLHLVCWWRLRGPVPPPVTLNSATGAGVKAFVLLISVSMGAFLLLCANEIFGQPPLMTRLGHPPVEMLGTWRADLTTVSGQPLPKEIRAEFTIAADGSVTGTVDDVVLTTGQFMRNRSWFGRLMNWRTDYLLEGTLSRVVESYGGTAGDRISAPLNPRGRELHGALFLSHPGAPKPLGLNLKKM
jgi:hypothetical protein